MDLFLYDRVPLHASQLQLKLDFFIMKFKLSPKDARRPSTQILPNMLERILYLLYFVYYYLKVLKMHTVNSE